ncbi:hypothetical protein [Halobacterium sp. CBA1126]|uniref:hypothetical protein n=1 Tax=Halobacterium TaxID=2239 RepID=UPI0012F9AA19|nr:hypothetical protein [Halobacterium sp. CBA1126]MUV60278.1 hypothetical protein [Halobacterium sp. CBA1126]
MSPTRTAVVALLVALAGCAGFAPADDGETTVPTSTPTGTHTDATTSPPTEPHTAVGTSHAPEHLSVRASENVDNVTVTLAPGGDTETYDLPAYREVDLTREVHERGHDVRVVVERGNETVFDRRVLAYESFDVTVYANDTRVDYVVV